MPDAIFDATDLSGFCHFEELGLEAVGLGVSWPTADSAVLAEGQRVLTGDEVVAMDGFTGFRTAAVEEPPGAVPVMDPFHVVRLAGDALDRCCQRGCARRRARVLRPPRHQLGFRNLTNCTPKCDVSLYSV